MVFFVSQKVLARRNYCSLYRKLIRFLFISSIPPVVSSAKMKICTGCSQDLPRADKSKYQACCGKLICHSCLYACVKAEKRRICPLCKAPHQLSEGALIERIKKRAELDDDAEAIYNLGGYYYQGECGLQQDSEKAVELWIRAGELGDTAAFNNLGVAYRKGEGVRKDLQKAKYYYELAATGGNVKARYNLGNLEKRAGNVDMAVKHWVFSAAAGDENSMKAIREGYLDGHVTEDDIEKASCS